MSFSLTVLTFISLLCGPAISNAGNRYPAVAPMQRQFHVPNVQDANVSVVIHSRSGAPLYHLQCHSADYTGDPDFNYSGEFECRLSLASGHDVYSTLLTEDIDQKKDWESRARFFAADLREPCSSIPNFGSTRTFRLRGMRLTLEIEHPQIDSNGMLKSLSLRVLVKPDPLATRQIAEIAPIPQGAPARCKIDIYFPDPASFSATK